MKELATQAASANTTQADRLNIHEEVITLKEEIDRIAASTKYGTTALIDGSFGTTTISDYGSLTPTNDVVSVDVTNAASSTSFNVVVTTSATEKLMTIDDGTTFETVTTTFGDIAANTTETLSFNDLGLRITVNSDYDQDSVVATDVFQTGDLSAAIFQVGSGAGSEDKINFSLGDMTAAGLAIDAIDVDSQSDAQTALSLVDAAIGTLATRRSEIGVTQNRFGFTIANIATSVENITAAESVIRDADLAFETIAFTKNQILLQAGTAMLAQANIAPQSILSVLG
jgi:flagellin